MTTQNAFRAILGKVDSLAATLRDILRWAVIEGVPEAGDQPSGGEKRPGQVRPPAQAQTGVDEHRGIAGT